MQNYHDLKITLRGDEANEYVLLRNRIAALADKAKAAADKLAAVTARLDQLTNTK